MKINEVERLVGITKGNIRFYEKEGLLAPGRNSENGYRDYSEADVVWLKKIKLLRQLDAILADSQGQVLRTDFTARQSGGLLTVTMLAECQEQIGVTVEREGETGRVYGENTAGDGDGQ